MKPARPFKIRNNSGFIEAEALLVGAIGLILLLAVAGSIASMMKFQKRADQSNESQIFARELALSLKSEDNCTNALSGRTLPAPTTYSMTSAVSNITAAGADLARVTIPEQPITFTVPIATQTVTVQPGFKPSNSLQVLSVGFLENAQYGELPFTLRDGTSVKEKLAIIRLHTERLENGLPAGTNPPKDIAVKVLLNPDGTIRGCNVSASAALTCEQMGGHWNPTAPPDQRCIPRGSCQYGGTYSTAPDNQGGYVNALTGAKTCIDATFTPQRTGTVTYASACGKTCVNNFYYPIYTCTRCGDDVNRTATNFAPISDFQEGDIGGTGSETAVNNALNATDAQINGL